MRDLTALQARIDAVEWYHEFDFGDGLRSRPRVDITAHRLVWEFIERHLANVDFRGKSVLDIGSWDGYWSFEAERRGAASVLATDDVSQNWAAGTGIHLARELLGSRIEVNQSVSVYDLATLGRTFDVILFFGVYYHLHAPFNAFAQIRHCCHPGTIVLIDGPVGVGLVSGGAVLDFRSHQAEYLPSLSALSQLTEAAYFREEATHLLYGPASDTEGPALGWRWRLAMAQAALRGRRSGVRPLAEQALPSALTTDRVFVKCRPFVGSNEIHCYRPPFGLQRYDDRFREATPHAA